MHAFDVARAADDVARLCAADFAGRRIGSRGHELARRWLLARFEHLGLAPELFRCTLDTPVLDVYDRPRLEVVGDGRVLRHRVDYAEHPRSADLAQATDGLSWAIIDAVPRGDDLDALVGELHGRGADGVLVPQFPTEDGYLPKRIASRAPVDAAVVAVSALLLRELDGKELRVRLPLRRLRPTGAHVVARIDGTDTALRREPVLVAAHYDGVGDDPGGLRLPGASDNASGVAVVLEVARVLAAARPPRRPIVVAALDGEEVDALGSKEYAEALARSGERPDVLNLDMAAKLHDAIAVEPGASPERTLDALDRAGEWLEQPLAIGNVSSDNRRFAQAGFPSVGIGLGGHGVHTPADTDEHVDSDAMLVAGRLLLATVCQLAG